MHTNVPLARVRSSQMTEKFRLSELANTEGLTRKTLVIKDFLDRKSQLLSKIPSQHQLKALIKLQALQ